MLNVNSRYLWFWSMALECGLEIVLFIIAATEIYLQWMHKNTFYIILSMAIIYICRWPYILIYLLMFGRCWLFCLLLVMFLFYVCVLLILRDIWLWFLNYCFCVWFIDLYSLLVISVEYFVLLIFSFQRLIKRCK